MDDISLLRALQDADSFFPSGAASFSWGLEPLCADGVITSEQQVKEFIRAQLSQRWFQFDRPIVAAAAQAAFNLNRVVSIDQLVEAQTLPLEFRSGSKRCGRALLSTHARIGTEGALHYEALVGSGDGKGHLALMQGFLWSRRGASVKHAVLMSAHVLCTGLLSAAIRLGVAGHVAAQQILREVHCDIVAMLETPPLEIEEIRTFMPQTDIASMRHETAQLRLFAN
jgi:urease accessory protein